MEQPEQTHTPVAFFISPHGFGHAARAAALMAAMVESAPTLSFDIFTTVPEWFFRDSIPAPFRYHPLKTDVGFVQTSPLCEDLDATLAALDRFLPFDADLTSDLARSLSALGCRLVVCDIAPLGIAVAAKANIPSVLVENFTWDRLYAGYPRWNGGFQRHIDYLEQIFGRADHHIQAEPVCRRTAPDLTAPPMSRKLRAPRTAVRRALSIEEGRPMVVVTMGGIEERYGFLERLKSRPDIRFVIPGGAPETQIDENLMLLPQRSGIYHPDLINASDALVGKAGYSTIAEAYQTGVPFGYIPRPGFPEMPGLVTFIEQRMPGQAIAPEEHDSGDWISRIDDLLALHRMAGSRPNGVDAAARYLIEETL
jgi:UDP:flavonoid glycosyltransferase YjiC (YdhE family)